MKIIIKPTNCRVIVDGVSNCHVGLVEDVEITLPNGREVILNFPEHIAKEDEFTESGPDYDLPSTD